MKPKYPKDRLTKCEEFFDKNGASWYIMTLFTYQDNFPNGVSIEYEETGMQIIINLGMNEWIVDTELPESIQKCMDAGAEAREKKQK